MGQITGRAKVSATATVSPITVGQNNRQVPHTLINEGAGLVGYRYQPGGASISDLADEAALRAAGAAILAAGESVVLPASTPYVELACPTGVTATVRIEPGEHQATLAAIAVGSGAVSTAGNKGFTANVGAASGTVLAANTDRKNATIVNYSDTLIWLALGTPAVAQQGIPLAPRVDANNPGGSYTVTNYTGIITGIHEGSGNKVVVGAEV